MNPFTLIFAAGAVALASQRSPTLCPASEFATSGLSEIVHCESEEKPRVRVTVGRILSGGITDRVFNILNESDRPAVVTVEVVDPFKLPRVQTGVLTVKPGKTAFVGYGNPHTTVTIKSARFE